MDKLKIAVSNLAWSRDQRKEAYGVLQDAGVCYLEVAPMKFSEGPLEASGEEWLKEELALVESFGLKVVSMQAFLFGRPDLTVFEGEERRQGLLEYIKRWIDYAVIVDSGVLVYGAPKSRLTSGLSMERVREIGLEFFREIAEYADRLGRCFLIEANHESYGGNFITNTSEAIEWVEAVDHPGFNLNLDLGAVLMNDELSGALIDRALPYTRHIHISEAFLRAVPQSRSDHIVFAKMIRGRGSDVCVSIEMGESKDGRSNIEQLCSAVNFVKEIYA